MTDNNKKIIRFGIMSNGMSFKRWQADAIESLLKLEQIECCLIIIDKRKSSGGKVHNLLKKIDTNILWQAYLLLSVKRFKAAESVNLSGVLTDVPRLECQVIKKGKYSEYFNEYDISEIKKYNLDFILRFGFGIIRGDILNSSKYGIWSFHHGDEKKYRGGPPCFWEIYNDDKITGSIIQRLTNKLDAGVVLKKGFLKTSYSYVKNRDQMYFESSKWPAQICKDILNGHIEYLSNEPSKTNAPIYYAPKNHQIIYYFIKLNIQRIKNIFKKLIFIDYWNIGIVSAPIHSFLSGKEIQPVTWFPNPPRNVFYADPFSVVVKGKLYIFFEEYPYKDIKGRIAYTCFENGCFSVPQTVISESFHLSYPYILVDKGNIYMIPESSDLNKIILYKAKQFPLIWEKEKVLIDNYSGIDSTLIEYNGVWWMFTSDKAAGARHNLNIFYSDDLFGEWHPHPQNPVKTDVRSARSAGTPFIYNGELYRPSMDYSEKIEGRITLNKVTTITKMVYSEINQNTVHPNYGTLYPDKIHTLCEAGNYTIIDGCKETCILINGSMIKSTFKLILNKLKANKNS